MVDALEAEVSEGAAARPARWRRVAGWVGAGLVVLAVVFLIGSTLSGYLRDLALWVEGLGAWGPLGLILVYVVATVAFAPGSLLTLVAGLLFGLVWGTVYAFVGATLGAAAAFLIARYLARSAVERRLPADSRFARIDRAIGRQGLKVVFLLRLSPVFPFNLTNYALGLTRVRFRDYLLASLGMLPGTFVYVYHGRVAHELATLGAGGANLQDAESYALLLLGLVATVALAVVAARIARRALREETEDA